MSSRRSVVVNISIIFAVAILVTILCRSFLVELYNVAPCQMENTLLKGDRVIVTKWQYGIRLPQSYISLPFIDTLPGCDIPAHYPVEPLPYKRVATQEVTRNDIIAFNYPMGESAPLSHYPTAISRCVGVPGDTICACDGVLYINGKPSAQSPVVTEAYLVNDSLLPQVEECMTQLLGETAGKYSMGNNTTMLYIDRYCYDKMQELLPSYIQLTPVNLSQDNYVVELPSCDKDVVITADNAAFYAHIINQYEPMKVVLHNDALYRAGRKINRYRFTQPYYWVLCDNRTAASDSRSFGVLPHSHIIGRCDMIIFSIDNRHGVLPTFRKSRFFKTIQ